MEYLPQATVADVLKEVDAFFMGTSPIHEAANRLVKTLDEMNIPFAIAGAIAVNSYGHQRTTSDLDILMKREDAIRFKEAKIGLGWVEKFANSKNIRDSVCNVDINILLAGQYPGDGLEKPVQFPTPPDDTRRDKRNWPILTLEKLIELKLACSMTTQHRPRDADDVIRLIEANQLPLDFGHQLNAYVHETWDQLWLVAQNSDDDNATL